MGEDRTTCTEKKPNDVVAIPPPCRHRHSSVISSCSEDAESESTSAGYPQSPDEEREEELEYGPGIVNKLRTRFLSITLKQNRGTNMRRSCSMENLLDQDRPCGGIPVEKTNGCSAPNKPLWGNLKRAKSMDTLLMELNPEPHAVKDMNGDDNKKQPKIIKRQEGGLNRLVPTICDEELPKPDTVKTYKRMFEPAESRRGSYCRRPPVLRASAKSCAASSKTNGVSSPSPSSAKVNGTTTKSKYSSAKQQASPVKAQPVHDAASIPNNINNNSAKKTTVTNGDSSPRPLYNGCHIVKATPVKIHPNNPRNSKDMEKNLNSINRLLNKKEVHFAPKTDIICNGNNHKEVLKTKTNDETVKPLSKTITSNGVEIVNSKPKVPPNRPNLKSPRPLVKVDDQQKNEKVSPSKLKPVMNGYKKSDVITDAQPKPPELNCKDEIKANHDRKANGDATLPMSPIERKQINEVKLLVENNVKDEVKLPPENKEKAEVKPPPQVKQKTRIPTPVDTPQKEDTSLIDNKTRERTVPDAPDLKKLEKPILVPETKITQNGFHEFATKECEKSVLAKKETHDKEVKSDIKPVKKSQGSASTTSMVFDFRGKDVVSHVAVLPVPFGCKGPQPKKRLVDGKEVLNGNGSLVDEEDDDFVDYSVPAPSGVVFEGENVKIGRGSILSTRNKELKIKFDDDVDSNTFVYPSESSLLEDPERSMSPPASADSETNSNGQHPPKLKTNTVIGTSSAGGLSTYTPSVLRTMENFEPGMFRLPPDKEDEKKRNDSEEEENTDVREATAEDPDMLKPADPDIISSWSLSAGTSDLLF